MRLVQAAARLLLEYNVRSSILVSRIGRLAAHLGIHLQPSVTYCRVSLHFPDGRVFQSEAPEYRINVVVSSGVLRVIDAVCAGNTAPADAIVQMRAIERAGTCHAWWLLALLFGLAASALARILQADVGAIIVAGVGSAVGLLVRWQLGRRHWPLFSRPFVVGVIGGVISGAAIRLEWTQTPGLCLIVPALMLVPGPHLINGLFEIFENHIQTGLCRLVLAVGILIAASSGTLFGGWAMMDLRRLTGATAGDLHLTLWLDMALAGVAACGFGAFYNAPWRVICISIACGMIGHGVRFFCSSAEAGLPGATLIACLAIGVLASIAVIRLHLPFAGVAFAAAVPMMPGTLIYRAIAGALQLSQAGTSATPALAASTLALLLQAILVIGAMAAGLLVGAFASSWAATAIRSMGAVRARG